MSPARPATEQPARSWAPYVLPVAGVVLSAGVALAQARETAAETDRLRVRLDAHVMGDTSAVLAEQVRTVRADASTLETDMRAMREAIERIDKNLVAVCAAQPRAQCTR